MRRPITTSRQAGQRAPGTSSIFEMQEFARFPGAAQRYIRRSLDVGLGRCDAAQRWARNRAEKAAIADQARVYRALEPIRVLIPNDLDVGAAGALMAPLVTLIAFDLAQDRLDGFASCRFLYERLIGPAVRPWLPAAFCAAAALPHLHPERRKALLQSLGEDVVTASGWSPREPLFVPEWVEKIDAAVAG